MSAKTYQKSSKTDRVNANPYAPLFFKKRSRRSKMKLYTAVFCLKVDRYKQCRLADENGSYSNHQRLNSFFTRCSAEFNICCLDSFAINNRFQRYPILEFSLCLKETADTQNAKRFRSKHQRQVNCNMASNCPDCL